MEKPVVAVGSKIERSFPLEILGNKSRISSRSILPVRRNKLYSDIPAIPLKMRKERGIPLKVISSGKDCFTDLRFSCWQGL